MKKQKAYISTQVHDEQVKDIYKMPIATMEKILADGKSLGATHLYFDAYCDGSSIEELTIICNNIREETRGEAMKRRKKEKEVMEKRDAERLRHEIWQYNQLKKKLKL